MITFERHLPQFIVLSFLVLSAAFRNPWFAAASITGLGFILTKEAIDSVNTLRSVKSSLPEEAKRLIQDLNARVATLEYGVKTRGF